MKKRPTFSSTTEHGRYQAPYFKAAQDFLAIIVQVKRSIV